MLTQKLNLSHRIREILAGGHPKTTMEILEEVALLIPAEMACKYIERKARSNAKWYGRKGGESKSSIQHKVEAGRKEILTKTISYLIHRGWVKGVGFGMSKLVWIIKPSLAEQTVVDERVRVWLEEHQVKE